MRNLFWRYFKFMFLFEYRRKQPDWDITWRIKMAVNTRIGAGQVYTSKKYYLYTGVGVLHSQATAGQQWSITINFTFKTNQ